MCGFNDLIINVITFCKVYSYTMISHFAIIFSLNERINFFPKQQRKIFDCINKKYNKNAILTGVNALVVGSVKK